MDVGSNGRVEGSQYCQNSNEGLRFTLRKVKETKYTVQNSNGQFLAVQTNGTIRAEDSVNDLEQDRFLFTLVQNLGGSVTFNSVFNTDKVIGTIGSSYVLETFNKDNLNERYYLRTECLSNDDMVHAEDESVRIHKSDAENTLVGTVTRS